MAGKVEQVCANAVPGEVLAEIEHDFSVSRKAMQQNHRAGGGDIGRRVDDRDRRMATAGLEQDVAPRQFALANPVRAECNENRSGTR